MSSECPCKDCITYIICKNALKEYILATHDKFSTVTIYRAYLDILVAKCDLFENYIAENTGYEMVNIKRIVLKAFDMTENDLADLIHTSVCTRRDNERTNTMY